MDSKKVRFAIFLSPALVTMGTVSSSKFLVSFAFYSIVYLCMNYKKKMVTMRGQMPISIVDSYTELITKRSSL